MMSDFIFALLVLVAVIIAFLFIALPIRLGKKIKNVNVRKTNIRILMDDGEEVNWVVKGFASGDWVFDSKSRAEYLIDVEKHFELPDGRIYLRHRVKEITMTHEDYWV